MADTLGTLVRVNVENVKARLRGNPDTAVEWRTISAQLRKAYDSARKIARLAEQMERSSGALDTADERR